MKVRIFIYVFLGILTALRLALLGTIELAPDEAYYFQWAQRLDWAYFSKGPGVALAIRAGTAWFGPTEFGVRFLSPLLACGTSLLLFFFARRLYSETVALWLVVALNLTPIFNVGSLLMTIDPLSIFFWTAALFACWRALEKSPAFSLWWPATGLLIGAGFLAKYTNAFQLLSVVLVLGLTRKWRRELWRPGFWSMLAAFLPALLPPLLWNARHDWVTLAHLVARGGGELRLLRPLEFFGAHFGVYSPILFAGLLVALWHGFRDALHHTKPRFLLLFAVPLLLFYLGVALRNYEANWTAPAFVSLGVLAAGFWVERMRTAGRWTRRLAAGGLLLGGLMSLGILNTDAVRALGVPWPYQFDPARRLRGWRSAAHFISDFRAGFETTGGQRVFLIANHYGSASALAFYLPDKRAEIPGHPLVYTPESQAAESEFFFWPRYDEFTDLRVVARNWIAAHRADPARAADCSALDAALAALPANLPRTHPDAAAPWQELTRALRQAAPELGLDEYYSEEEGVSLFAGWNALYITDRPEDRPPTTIRGAFETCELVAHLRQERRGRPLRELRIFACHNYRSLPL